MGTLDLDGGVARVAWMVNFLLESFLRMPATGTDYKLPKFYLLYKVHKATLGFLEVVVVDHLCYHH